MIPSEAPPAAVAADPGRRPGRALPILAGSLALIALAPRGARAQEAVGADPLTDAQVIARVTRSIDRGLAYLARQQLPDGSWHRNNAVNSVALLAFLGRGHTPGRGPYREVLARGRGFLVRAQKDENGYISFSTMYEHGMATLALAELYGMDPDPDVEQALRRAVKLIVGTQNRAGGWRYNPAPNDADLSVTIMQVVALRAANNAEIPVPEETINKAISYVKSCFRDKGFAYQVGGALTPQMTAAGCLALQLLGRYDDPELSVALESLAKYPVEWKAGSIQYFYYFHYYAIQALYQGGGRRWNEWNPKIRELLLEKQDTDGSWEVPPGTAEGAGTVGPNRVYWTAMGCLVLEIYMHFLPAYQR